VPALLRAEWEDRWSRKAGAERPEEQRDGCRTLEPGGRSLGVVECREPSRARSRRGASPGLEARDSVGGWPRCLAPEASQSVSTLVFSLAGFFLGPKLTSYS